MGETILSSRLLKASKVVETSERKLLTVVNPLHPVEVIEQPKDDDHFHQEKEMMMANMMAELEERRRQAEKELQTWRENEEEHFRVSMKEKEQEAYTTGYTAGFENGKEQYTEKIQQATDILQQAYEEKAKLIKEAEPFVIHLSIEIAKKIVQQELQQNEDTLIQMIRQALLTINDASTISIGVAPSDFDFVQKQRQQLLAVMDGQVEVKVFPDYSISEEGCRILTPYGSIDARIDVQLNEIKKVLLSCKQVDEDE